MENPDHERPVRPAVRPRHTIKVAAVCANDTLTKARVRQFEVVVDEPPGNHGADLGPQPLEYLLASFAGCTNVIAHKICRERGITLLDMEVDVAGVLDTRGIFGADKVEVPFPRYVSPCAGRRATRPRTSHY